MGSRAVLWDFDGTLAERPGMWSGALLEALSLVLPSHGVTRDALRPGLRDGFPWHTPDVGHSHADADAWWGAVGPLMSRACVGAGVPASVASEAVVEARRRYLDPATWRVFPDAVPALERLASYTHVIVSNHVPELPALVAALGLAPYFQAVVTSAVVGWEKPNPRIYALALEAAGSPSEVWMVGDNPVCDVEGAVACGIRGVLVRGGEGVDLAAATEVILRGQFPEQPPRAPR